VGTASLKEAGEWLFVAALGASWANSTLHVAFADTPLYALAARELRRLPPMRKIIGLLGATALFVAALWMWHDSPWRRAGAVVVLVCLIAIRAWETRQWHGNTVVRLGKYVPAAACLLGWLGASTVTSLLGWSDAEAEAAGWEGAAGVFASLYVLAGLSKLKLTGLSWMRPAHQALLIAERAFTGPAFVRRLRRAASRSRFVCGTIGVYGLVSELLAGLYVFPVLRMPLTVGFAALHVGIVLLLGYIEPEWWLVMVAVTLVST
jgi:hypothetical protein